MKLGFVSAILPELTLDQVFAVAADLGYASVEVMCWPPGWGVERRYAGVTHLDATTLDAAAVAGVHDLMARHGVGISGLGYYPNPLDPDLAAADAAVAHLHRVIDASADLGIDVVNSFVGRDPQRSVEANWPRFVATWTPLVEHAEARGVRIGIENCPMLFGPDEWPGGKNLATTPAIWRQMFAAIPSPSFGLNLDPSHFIWQQVDYCRPLAEFADRIVHVHAKDARVDRDRLDELGVLSHPKRWHTPKLPGLGEVAWGRFLGTLAEVGYDGHVAVEVEDRAFEGTLAKRRAALAISQRYLHPFIAE